MSVLEEQIPQAAGTAGISLGLSKEQESARKEFRSFVESEVSPHAGRWERQGAVPDELVEKLRERRYLATTLAPKDGGLGMDAITYGLLTSEMGRGCSSVRSLLTVHDMATAALARWGKTPLKERYLPALSKGELLGALALSEPNVGSAAHEAETTARQEGDHFVLDGEKCWITFGQIADLFLLLAQLDGKPTAFLVPADSPGLVRKKNAQVMGTRASRLARLELAGCRIPADHLLGRPGFGFSYVISYALDLGRYSVAWGSVGIAEACLEACLDYANSRRQGGALLSEHQLIQRRLTDMIADSRAARLLCYRAGYLRDQGEPAAVQETNIAKYFASRAATRCANSAVQLHGANGMTDDYSVARYLRDAKVMEIIEGSTEIQQTLIPRVPPEEVLVSLRDGEEARHELSCNSSQGPDDQGIGLGSGPYPVGWNPFGRG